MGRGFIQLTGKANYEIVSNAWNNDVENTNDKKYFHKQASDGGHIDELVNNTDVGLKASLYFWKKKKLNGKADVGTTDDDIDNLGYVINGINPPNDYKTRRTHTKDAKQEGSLNFSILEILVQMI